MLGRLNPEMLSLPPPPPPPEPPSPDSPLPPPPREATPISLKQIIISKPPSFQHSLATEKQNPDSKLPRQPSLLRHPRPRRTNLLIWCGVTFCFIFSLLLIFFGIATLIVFLVVRPKIPVFDTTGASLSTIYFDAPEYFNGDFTILANFSNPNHKMGVRFEYLETELYFYNKLIATQVIKPFSQQPRETRLATIRMISSLVYLPQNFAGEWLHSRCQIEMTGPPTGILVGHNCRTKR